MPKYRTQIFAALVEQNIPWCVVDGEPAFAWPAVLPALQLREDGWDPGGMAAHIDRCIGDGDLTIVRCPVAPGPCHTGMVRFHELVDALVWFSLLPACMVYRRWMTHEFLPAIRRHRYYDPDTGHEVPVGQELDALERKETMVDHVNALLPVFGLRRLVDEDGNELFMNDADLPDNDGDEEEV
jgi:hypothetical protein